MFAGVFAVCWGCEYAPSEHTVSQGGEPPQDAVMKIRLERSGGFAGMSRTVEVDSHSLSQDERNVVTRLLDDSNFFTLPTSVTSTDPGGADRFQYRITVESAQRTHTVEVTEASAPDSLEPLIDWLNRKGRTGRMDSTPRP